MANVYLSTANSPTLLIGDFKSTKHVGERIACNTSHRDSFLFNNWINQANLIELNIINAKYTWIGPAGKRSRLDRAFVNASWANLGYWKLKALPRKNSNHEKLLVFLSDFNWGPKPFKIYNVWFKEESLKQSLESFQSAGIHFPDVQSKLRKIKQLIKEWNINSFGNINKRIEDKKAKIVI